MLTPTGILNTLDALPAGIHELRLTKSEGLRMSNELTDHLKQLEAQAASDLNGAVSQLQSSQPGTAARHAAIEEIEDAMEMFEHVEEMWPEAVRSS